MSRVRTYVVAIALVAASALLVSVLAAPVISDAEIQGVLWLSMLGLISLLQQYQMPSGGSASTAFIPFLACILLSPTWITIAAVACADSLAELINRRQPLKLAFNVSQKAVATSAGIGVYRLFGGQSLLTGDTAAFVTTVAVGAVVITSFAANYFAVNGVIALSERRRFSDVWRQNTRGTLIYDVFSAPVVFLLAAIYVHWGPIGALAVFLPILGIRQLYKTNRELSRLNEELLQLMVKAIEARDPYTSGHSRRVAHYSRIIARAVGLNSRLIDRAATAALLHDVGKIHEVFAPILQKPGKLTAQEWAVMQTHPIKSAELVETVSHLRDIVGAVRHHHENWDGSGYPDGIVGASIPIESRIIMFADTIDAMTTDRPYRRALTKLEVRQELERCSGTQFDPDLCRRLLDSPMFELLFSPDDTIELEARASRSAT
ncbi:MAG TPA: HD domain-containing phosphohydrolase, partial [Gemmatimonadaceae bacterium]|nr:HD domain-containing phosphohydrolase [Gemmatimonadaceae bacterium]